MWSSARLFPGREDFRRVLLSIAVAGCGWSLAACETGVDTETVRLDTAFDRTGTLRKDGVYAPMTDSFTVRAGDMGNMGAASNLELRVFVSVTLGVIPAGANVIEVVLHLDGQVHSGNPYADFGTLDVDHVNIVSGIGLEGFYGKQLTGSFATVPAVSPTGISEVEVDVTDAVKADIAAGRPISSFRLWFRSAPTLDFEADAVSFHAAPDNPDLRPYAIVTYQP